MSKTQKTKESFVIGIQGGPGSFNEQAARSFLDERDITDYRIKYLYTTRNVLKALAEKNVNRGMFAVQNSLSGVVFETINALSEFNCRILESFVLNISHTLYASCDVSKNKIKTIISHPVALDQCRKTLAKKYPNAKLETGKGKMIDQATAARALAEGKLPMTTAVLAAPYCALLYDLDVLEEGLRDKKANFTTFLFVSRFQSENGR